MSFSGNMRAELAQIIPTGRPCRDTALATLLANIARFSAAEDGGTQLRFLTGNPDALRKCFTLIRKTVNISPDYFVCRLQEDGTLPDAPDPGTDVQCLPPEFTRLLRRLHVLSAGGTVRSHDGTVDGTMIQGAKGRVYLREMFLCTGFMNDPKQRYHLEFRCFSQAQAEQLREVLGGQGIPAGMTRRKKYHVVYVKDSEDIVTFLHLTGAHVSLMATENARIYKEVRNSVNRRVNCETANIGKTVESAGRQIEDIRLLRANGILDTLPAALQEAAALREEQPGASLAELGALADPPVGRSGMNHRLRKLTALAGAVRSERPATDADDAQGAPPPAETLP